MLNIFLSLKDTDPEEEKTKRLSVGTLTVLEDDRSSPRANVLNLAVVVEDTIILEELSDLPTGFAYLFGLIYASNIQYPKGLRYTFETVQKIFMGLGKDLSLSKGKIPLKTDSLRKSSKVAIVFGSISAGLVFPVFQFHVA